MKKLMTLLIAAGLVFSAAHGASAVEVKASGQMDFAFDYGTTGNDFMSTKAYNENNRNSFFGGDSQKHNKRFSALQRLRINLDFIASENLSAHYQAQVGTFTWGGPAQGVRNASGTNFLPEANGGALGTRAANIVTRLAYLDWMIPNSDVKVRMGQQSVAMPSFVFGSPVLDDTATGILLSGAINENISLTGGWLRANSGARRGSDPVFNSTSYSEDTFDLFTVVANFKYDGFQVAPWALVGPKGKNSAAYDGLSPLWGSQRAPGNGMPQYDVTTGNRVSGFGPATLTLPITPGQFSNIYSNETPGGKSTLSNSFVWFAGIGAELTMFDPFRFAFDFYYSANDTKHSYSDRSGWYVAGSADYKTAYGTPGLKAWYSTGDDKKVTNGSERPLSLSAAFNPTLNYFDGRYGIAETIDNSAANGTWGVGLYWNGLSFMENLTHDFAVVYFQGTNDKMNLAYGNFAAGSVNAMNPSTYMTTKDSAVELDFTSTYNIYQNLATALELSYIIQNFDGKTWGKYAYAMTDDGVNFKKAKFDNIFRATVNFKYTF